MKWGWLLAALLLLGGCSEPQGKTASQIQAEAEQAQKAEDFSALGVEMFPSENGLAVDGSGAESIVATSSAEGLTLDAYRVTKSPAKEVAVFYMSRLSEPVNDEVGGVVSVEGVNRDGNRVRVTASEKDGRTAFTVSVKKQTASDQTPESQPEDSDPQ